ncbi:MAG: RIP metalloprotease RseP [Thermodesulfovibrionia bacterium]
MSIFWAIILFGILIFFHEFGHFIVSKLVGVKVLKFSLGFGPKVISKRIGETEYIISALPLGGYVKPLGEEAWEELSEEERPRAFNFQPVWKRVAIVFAGPLFNLFLAYLIFVAFFIVKLPVAIPDLNSITTTIEDVAKDSPAMRAGLKKDDTIIEIDGRSVKDWNEMAEVFANNPNRELSLKVRRGGELIDIKVTPDPTEVETDGGKKVIVGRIGISKKLSIHKIEGGGILNAPIKGIEAVYQWSVLTLVIIKKLLIGALSAKQLGGPILIVSSAQKAAEVGVFAYLNLVAMISINLAVLNLLPIPVLDGGHLLFFGIEAIRRKPLSEKVLLIANRIGMALLIMLMAFVFYNDIMRFVMPWFKGTLTH